MLSSLAGRPVKRYMATISSRDPRKNIAGAIRAFALARRQLGDEWHLAVVGHASRLDDAAVAAAESGVESSILFTGPLNDAAYVALLAGAGMFLFLSLYEGFGLPVLEAMAAGTPVIAGDNSCLPEVVGSAGLLAEATDAVAVATHIVTLATDAGLRGRLSRAGLARAAEFTWDRTAAETVACYRRAIG